MSFRRFAFELRAEDVLNVLAAFALAVFAGSVMRHRHLGIDEDSFWDIAYILIPVACLVFAASCRYAFRPLHGDGIANVSSEWWRILRDWSPFLFFSMLYSMFRLDIWGVIAPVDKDALLLRWDRALFGETPAVLLERFNTPWLTSSMSFAYALHVVLPPLFALLWYWRDLFTFRWLLLSIFISGIIGANGYVLMPAVGPEFAFPSLFHGTLGGGAFRNAVALLDAARAMRDAFPSLHVAISSIVLWFAWKRGRGVFAVILPLVLANWLSTMYLRYHYLVDVIAGWATAAASIALARGVLEIETRIRQRAAPVSA